MKNDLHLIIYLLHFIDEEYINKKELERAVFTLNELGERLQEIHIKISE